MLKVMIQVDASKRPTVDKILKRAKWFRNDKCLQSRSTNLYKALEVEIDLVERMKSVKLNGPKFKKPRMVQ